MTEKKDEYKNCNICGGWHHPKAVHLDYVGHAALTDRLLDCDPGWNWEPLSFGQDGMPMTDQNGGMWIRLTVCGVSRLGYGHPDGKRGGDAVKEVIGDALRNAAMRFGAALDLWHKGDLHGVDNTQDEDKSAPEQEKEIPQEEFSLIRNRIRGCPQLVDLNNERENARKAKPRMSIEQQKAISLEIEKKAAFFAQAPLEGEANGTAAHN